MEVKEQNPLYHSPVAALEPRRVIMRDTDRPFGNFVFVFKLGKRISKEEGIAPEFIRSSSLRLK
jgi:hypothetical protein